MSAGTLTLTNNSAAVAGSGTAFTTEVAAGDFIVVTVGGVPYTLPVKSVESGTALTLVSNFTGPTQSGAAWSAVPRMALNMVTAALVAQSAEALRGLNYDKQNWQQVFSGTGNITVKLPDGNSYTGPAWRDITTALERCAKKGNNSDITELSGLTTPLSVSHGGTGGEDEQSARRGISASTNTPLTDKYGDNWYAAFSSRIDFAMFSHGDTVDITEAWDAPSKFTSVNYFPSTNENVGTAIAASLGSDNDYFLNSKNSALSGYQSWKGWVKLWHTKNTVVDSSGFIKKSSPVIKIFTDGKHVVNEESDGCTVVRQSKGVYLIDGCIGLNADAAWGGTDGGFEIPVDRNKQPRIWLDYKVNADGSVLVRTYHRVHPSAPEFAQNRIGNTDINGVFTETVADGELVDIPADSFVSVRVEMPEDSIWNQRQKETREALEKAERERQQNQQGAQS
ncbi:phage tail protein [Citrobacter portucalensis]|uniref:phage tail fiber protein n=1 Tax=Citrobacter portucalensis TaxID=1639133 RepID=UPI0002412B69|nr:hypothetical protein [Citrobacter portucalensis]EHL86477.1 hypothetical protein HMPREF9428_03506 [Citrobacter portucalensis]MBJ9083888.1 phage tail protein [Citrobacter freundii]QGS15387.1 phage tail protein [Citrobacter portucalensis]